MHRVISTLSKFIYAKHSSQIKVAFPISGLKVRTTKKPSSTVFAELSSEYMQKHQEEQEGKRKKEEKKVKSKEEEKDDLMEIKELKNSWLGNALEDDLLVETREWQGETELDAYLTGEKSSSDINSSTKQSPQQQPKRLFSQPKLTASLQQSLIKIKSFKTDLSKTQHINNSRKFLEIICNIFPRYQVERVLAEIKEFCSKRDLNIPLGMLNIDSDKSSAHTKKQNQKKIEKEIKLIEKITKEREKKMFLGVRKIFDESLTDLELIDNLLSLLCQSDPYIMNSQDIHKLIYSHEQGVFENEASHHKAEINLVIDKKQKRSEMSEKDEEKINDQLILAKKDFLKETEEIMDKTISKKQKIDKESQEDFIDVFDEFLTQGKKEAGQRSHQKFQRTINSRQQLTNFKAEKQKKRQKSMNLIVKKNINSQQEKPTVPQHFQINQQSLHQIERILFKNKKIIEDNVVFKKVKPKNHNQRMEKQRQEFGANWVYAYEMPYSLEHQSSQQFIEYVSKNYGDIIEYYIFPYKNMLEKRENIMIYIDNQKRAKNQTEITQKLPGQKEKKPEVADKLLEKIEREKSLKLNKSSMVFKFRSFEEKQNFLLPEMRLYGINFKAFRNIRFEEAQSKKIIAISMIPWGCSSDDLQKTINKTLKPIDVQVSYQACILAKGFIFVEFDNFYECLNACQLLNNLQFQGHSLKVQINYGSSKLYGDKFKNALEFDHYETLVKKLKDIKCFYNQIYQD